MDTTATETVFEYLQSSNIGKIGEALAAAQGEILNAATDSTNPHFRSSYTSLAGVIDAIREPFAKYKIARPQFPLNKGDEVGVMTLLVHPSGEWMATTAWCKPERPGPQAQGSVITYLRRYSLAAAAGLAQDDDDAESAEKRPRKSAPVAKLDGKTQARIKILQAECGIEEREWREKLSYHYGVESSAELSPEAAKDLIQRLEQVKRTKAQATAQSGTDNSKSEGQG